jgi:hypothetical protein
MKRDAHLPSGKPSIDTFLRRAVLVMLAAALVIPALGDKPWEKIPSFWDKKIGPHVSGQK